MLCIHKHADGIFVYNKRRFRFPSRCWVVNFFTKMTQHFLRHAELPFSWALERLLCWCYSKCISERALNPGHSHLHQTSMFVSHALTFTIIMVWSEQTFQNFVKCDDILHHKMNLYACYYALYETHVLYLFVFHEYYYFIVPLLYCNENKTVSLMLYLFITTRCQNVPT